jgi:hypothetical protein
VRPLIAYLESVMISSRQKCGADSTVARLATSSPTLFDWCLPGTLMAWFLALLVPNQMPAPHFMFIFPLLMHAPSVNTLSRLCLLLVPWSTRCWACWAVIILGSVKIRKQSVRSLLLVNDGSNIMVPCSSWALWFCALHQGVSDKSPF